MSNSTSKRWAQRLTLGATANPPHSGVVVVADVAATSTAMLVLQCERCGRRGRLSVARLLRERGPHTALATIAYELTAGCPRRDTRDTYGRCDPHWPGLGAFLGP